MDVKMLNKQNMHSVTIDDTKKINPALIYIMGLRSMLSRKKMGCYLNKAAKLMGYAGLFHCEWAKMRRHDIIVVIEYLRRGARTPNTINTYLSALKGVANEARMLKLMDIESYQDIKNIKRIKGERISKGRTLSIEESDKLLAVCEADKKSKGLRDGAIISLLLGCGLRRSELVSLNLQDIDFENESIKVIGKGDKERVAFMPDDTKKKIHSWINEVRGNWQGPLFTRIRKNDDVREDRITPQAIYDILRSRQIEANIKNFTPHDLRRTYANDLLNMGENIMLIKEMMGHSSVTTTQRYLRVKEEQMRSASKKLNLRKKSNKVS